MIAALFGQASEAVGGHKRRDNQHPVDPRFEGPEPPPPNAEWEEIHLVEPAGRLKLHVPQLLLHEIHIAQHAFRHHTAGHSRQRGKEFTQGTVARGGIPSVGHLAIQHEHGIPGTIEGQIAAEDQETVQDRPLWRHVAQCPDLRMEDRLDGGRCHFDDRVLQVPIERFVSRDADLAGLTEDDQVVGVAA